MPVRVVIDPGSHAVLNLGDVAMLQVAVERLEELWPGALIEVLTTDPEALARHVPRGRPLPAQHRYDMTGAYAELLAVADLLVVAGRGGLTDAQGSEALQLLDEIELARQGGTPVALVGQGVGPIRESRLVARAAQVLPQVALVAVRERRLAVPLLEALGVPGDRVAPTGDDSIATVLAARHASPAASGIGLSVRVAEYSGVDAEAAEEIGRAVRAAAVRHESDIVPLPISLYPAEDEAARLARLAGADLGPVETVGEAIGRAGRCRVVVAGSYHAAVFALSQGVPAVGLVASPYYSAKMEGLREEFGGRMAVVPVGGRLFDERLGAAIDAAWTAPEAERAALVQDAERQVAAGRAAYRRLAGIAGLQAVASGRE